MVSWTGQHEYPGMQSAVRTPHAIAMALVLPTLRTITPSTMLCTIALLHPVVQPVLCPYTAGSARPLTPWHGVLLH